MSISKHIKNIIFDLGNVIDDIDPQLTLEALEALNKNPSTEFKDGWKLMDQFYIFEKGDWTDEEFREKAKEFLNNPTLENIELDRAWNKLLLDIDTKRIDLLLELKIKYRTFILSNTNSIHIKEINNKLSAQYAYPMSLDGLVEKCYYSHVLHATKPDPEVFMSVLKENGLTAKETLFIDDRLENIEGAKKVGIETIHLHAPTTILDIFNNGI